MTGGWLPARKWAAWCAVLMVGLLAGCGGGGAGSGGGGGNGGGAIDAGAGGGLDPLAGLVPTPAPDEFRQTARFTVDVPSGQVTIDQADPAAASRAVLSGTAVAFESSLLLDEAGDSGIKVLRVTLKNQSGLSIGRNADGTVTGLRVLFSEPRSLAGAPLDLRDRCTVSTWAGTGAYSSVDGRLDEASFQGSVAVATGDGSVQFVTDFGSGRVRQIRGRHRQHRSHLRRGRRGPGAAQPPVGPRLQSRRPLAVGVWTRADTESGGSPWTACPTPSVGAGCAGSTDGPGGTALCNRPTGITVSPTGDVYFTEGAGNRVRQITYMGGNSDAERRLATNYQVTTIAGSGLAGIADGTSNTVLFNNPLGIAWGDGNLYVADTGNRRIRRVSVTGETVTIAGTGVSGSSDGYGDTATFNSPVGICWTSRGLVITDRSAHVVRLCSLRSADAPSSSPSSWIVRRAGR